MADKTHPWWCARGHVCSARRMSAGQHRSHPQTYDTPMGSVIFTRARTRRRDVLEVRLVLDLPAGDELTQSAVAAMLLGRVDKVMTTPLPAIRRAAE